MDQSQHLTCQTHMQGGSVFRQLTWPPGEQHQLEVFFSPDSASMSLQQKVVRFLVRLFGGSGYLIEHWGMINLVQFWAPFRTDTGETRLSVLGQPFGVAGQLCAGLLEYLNECTLNSRTPCVGHDPVSLAFQNHTSKYAKLTSGWCAEVCDFPNCWALPLVEPLAGCVGVLEFISLSDCSELYDRGSRLYERFCSTFFTNGHFLENLGDQVPTQQYVRGYDNSYWETMNVMSNGALINASEDQMDVPYEEATYSAVLRLPNDSQIFSIVDHHYNDPICTQENVEGTNFQQLTLEAANGDTGAQHDSAPPTSKVAPTCNKEIDNSYIVKAKYEGFIVRFTIYSRTTIKGLCKMLSKRFKQQKLGGFTIEYKDAITDSPIMISSTKDLKAFLNASKTMELFVISGNY